MKYTFTSYLNARYNYGTDFTFSEVPYTYKTLNWINGEKPSEEDINLGIDAYNAEEPCRQLRILRDKKLKECDWITIKAYSQGLPLPEEWATYIQNLRDITSQSPKLDDNGNLIIDSVIWPTEPS